MRAQKPANTWDGAGNGGAAIKQRSCVHCREWGAEIEELQFVSTVPEWRSFNDVLGIPVSVMGGGDCGGIRAERWNGDFILLLITVGEVGY